MITRIIAALVTAGAAVVMAAPGPASAAPASAAATPIDLCARVSNAAGFRGGALVTAVAVAMAESTCNPNAFHVNPSALAAAEGAGTAVFNALAGCTQSIDRGLYQINSCAHPDVTDECAFDAQCNADFTYTLSAAGSDWSDFNGFTGGSYRTFLADARAAVQRLGIEQRPLCVPVTGDWDGNGSATMGLACKPGDGQELQWELINVNNGGSPQIHGHFGSYGCVPVTGDWDGDGQTTIGVACRTAEGRIAWALSNAYSGGVSYSFTYGSADLCRPVTGDWNGDGRTSVGVACRTERSIEIQWSLINSLGGGSPSYETFGFGSTSCWPVTGDWDGDRATSVGVACPSGAEIRWSLINSLGGGSPSYATFGFGNSGACWPVTGDWDFNRVLDRNRSTTIGIACSGAELTWSLLNIHRGGSPAVRTPFGTGRSYTASTGWDGPNWPRWPNPF